MDDDKKLYNEFLANNQDSFYTLINKYKKNVIYFISRYVKNLDAAEDIFQDIILYLLENKFNYDSKYSFKTYLYIIAKSKSINYMKKYNNRETSLTEYDDFSVDYLEEIIFSNEIQSKLKTVLKQLKTDYQIVIYLTQIEGLSYKEASLILNKTEKQIKNLAYNAKKTLKILLIKERMIEVRNNKFIRILSWFLIIGIVVSGIVCASKVIIEKINNANLNPTFSGSFGNISGNQVWVGTFNLAWNDLMDFFKLDKIEFEEGNSSLADELNKRSFSKDYLSEKDYYTAFGAVNTSLRTKIETDLKNKFNENSNILDRVNWNDSNNHYLLYSTLRKEFTFNIPFPKRDSDKFGNSDFKVEYFGLEDSTIDDTFNNVEALFHNSKTDFAVKINTKEGEELYLYRTNNTISFENSYYEMLEKSKQYSGRKTLKREKDKLKVPFIKVNADINYDELCNKHIKGTDAYINQTIQTVDFELDNYGGHVKSEAMIDMYLCMSFEEQREFNFTDTFVLFMKEKGKGKPYFALLVENTDVLIKDETATEQPQNQTVNYIIGT